MSDFKGFNKDCFDAYEQHKWTGGRFNLERMRAREVVESLVRDAVKGLSAVEGLTVRSSEHHPNILNGKKVDAQWVALGREAGERRRLKPLLLRERALTHQAESALPQRQEVVLSVRLDALGVEVGLRLHRGASLDRRNLKAKLSSEEGRLAFAELLGGLPSGTVVQLGAEVSAAATTPVPAILEALGSEDAWLMIGRSLGRDESVVAGPELVEVTRGLLAALAPLYRAVAWSDANDHLGGAAFLAEELEREAKKAEAARAPAPPALAVAPPVPVRPPRPMRPARPNRPPRPTPRKPTTKGGAWSYRPDWQFGGQGAAASEAGPLTPSARVREMAQEVVQKTTREWNYSGPAPVEGDRGAEADGNRGGARPGGAGGDRRDGRPGGDRREGRPGGDRREGRPGGPGGDRRDGRPGGPGGDRRDGRPGGDRRDGRPGGPGGDRRDGRPGGRPGGDRRDGGRPSGGPRRDGDRGGFGGRGDRRGGERGGFGGHGGPRGGGPIVAAAKVVSEFKDAPGEVSKNDHVRVTAGLFSGKIGKVIDLTRKGYKVAVGDMVFEVKRDQATRLAEA